MKLRHRKGFFTAVIFTAALFMIMHTFVYAGAISGKITDKTDGMAMYRVTVAISSDNSDFKKTGTVTDLEGNFKLESLPAGIYTVIVSSMGFASQTYDNITLAERDNKTLNSELSPTYINFDAVSVTASRRQEKILESPAAVSVLESENIENRATLTPTEHIKGMPAVDVATTGLNQSNVVVRGFNNIFSGSLLVLTDNRIARVPSLRFNAYNFIATTNEDIERIEIVLGPGSALYGPNSAGGVMHIITKSPFSEQGTQVSIGGGERELMLGSFRHAGLISNKVAYKFSGQYYQGRDWKHTEPTEPDSIRLYRTSATGPKFEGDVFLNKRDYGIEKMAGEGRIDFLIGEHSSLILNSGFSRASSIELTGLGAAQAIDWTYAFAQARYRYKDLFVQSFVNSSDAGDTYLLETGQLIVDRSKLWAGQIQHFVKPVEPLTLTYGFDMLLTRPDTDRTINGRNEGDDNIDEYGLYLQSDLKINQKLKLVTAARIDNNNRLTDNVISPRAALVYQPKANHSVRLTYNRAYSTPDNNNLYLDLLKLNDMGGIGDLFEPSLHFRPEIDIRVQGVPESGFHWRINDQGPQFRSSFAPAAGLSTSDYINFNDPMFTNVMWNIGRGATIAGFQAKMAANNVPQGMIDALSIAMDTVTTEFVSGVNNSLMTLNTSTGLHQSSSVDDISDIERLKPTITQTFEIGYNGIIGNRLKFSGNVYRTKKNDFIGPLSVESPNVFLDPATLQAYLGGQFTTTLGDPAYADEATTLMALDSPAMGGNGNGTVVDELTAMFTSGAGSIPFGTVTPDEAYDPTAVFVTYRNFGDISFYGADMSFDYHLNQNLNFGGNYSYITKNFFEKSDDQPHDINLNSPKHKFGFHVQYMIPARSLSAQLRFRFIDAFDMDSPFFGSSIASYNLVDFSAGLDFVHNTHISLTIQNVLDNRHIEFIGAPEIGRLTIMRLSQTF
ncbi:MAG: TonB-dependent receptor [candidate division Zixibacteria bacterium]|nr:TonB-dependent receptor [candidate division Zixibacteria bacterium]